LEEMIPLLVDLTLLLSLGTNMGGLMMFSW